MSERAEGGSAAYQLLGCWGCNIKQVDLDRIDLNLLKVFVALFEEGSVTAAGARLGLAQSSLSHALTRLRIGLDDQLFVRGASGMSPTPYAFSLIDPVRTLLEGFKLVLDRGRAFDPLQSDRTFTIIMTDLHEMILLPQLLMHFATAAPNVKFICQQILHSQYKEAFETGGADVALGQIPKASPEFYQQMLVEQPFACFMRADHPLTGRMDFEAFMGAQHLIAHPVSMGEVSVNKALGVRAAQRRIVLQGPHYMAAPFILAKTDLIAVFPRALDRHFYNLGIAAHDVPFSIEPGATYQYWHGRSHNDPGCMWLRAAIKSIFTEWQTDRIAVSPPQTSLHDQQLLCASGVTQS